MNVFRDHGVEIRLAEEEDFLKIKETLQRIGVPSRNTNTLTQTCHILHKQGRYAIMHFKQMLALDGKDTNFSEEDLGRLNTIAKLLEDWGLLKIVDSDKIKNPRAPISKIKIIPFRDKRNWTLVAKYQVGTKRY